MSRTKRSVPRKPRLHQSVTLRMLADHLGLAPATISVVINGSPIADAIPQTTKNRIVAAARQFGYRPNPVARSLRKKRSFTIGVLVPEISEGYAATVMSGLEDYLLQAGFLYFVASHRHRPDLIEEYPKLLLERSIEGIIAIDTPCTGRLPVPVVAVSGHGRIPGVTNIELNHARAATLALDHLFRLGHRRIAFIKGQAFSSDTEFRWQAMGRAARELGLVIDSRLTSQLEGDLATPELGYVAARKLTAAREPFTALFAFNDISAIGAIRALREAGLRVPEDVSVVGFDDIQSAAYQNPGLTTVRQPLRKMGELAAETMLRRLGGGAKASGPHVITVEPDLVVRGSTCAVRTNVAAVR